MRLSPAETTLVGTIYSPPRARAPWTLATVLPPGAARYYSLARWGLVEALRGCGVGHGDRVLVPELICRDVLSSLHAVGAVAAFYPVDDRLRGHVEAIAADGVKAVLAVDYFGFAQRLDGLQAYCAQRGAALIEDNAQGLFSRDEAGVLLGGRGDAGIFSFRKTIAVRDGGAVVFNAPRRTAGTPPVAVSSAVNPRYTMKQAFRHVARHLGAVRTQSVIGGIRQLRRLVTGDPLPVGAPDAETRIPMAPQPAAMIAAPIAVADPVLEAERRRALYDVSLRVAAGADAAPVFPTLPPGVVPYGLPLLADVDAHPRVAAHFARYGLPVERWSDVPAAVDRTAAERYRRLLIVPFLW